MEGMRSNREMERVKRESGGPRLELGGVRTNSEGGDKAYRRDGKRGLQELRKEWRTKDGRGQRTKDGRGGRTKDGSGGRTKDGRGEGGTKDGRG